MISIADSMAGSPESLLTPACLLAVDKFHLPHHVCCLRVALTVHVDYEGGAKRRQFLTVEFPVKTWMFVTCRDLLWKTLRVWVSKMAEPCQDAVCLSKVRICHQRSVLDPAYQLSNDLWLSLSDFCSKPSFSGLLGSCSGLGMNNFPTSSSFCLVRAS